MTKKEIENMLQAQVDEFNKNDTPYRRRLVMNDWEKNGKSRTYFSIVEICRVSKHYKKRDYGYFDNITGTFNDENALHYDFGGMLIG